MALLLLDLEMDLDGVRHELQDLLVRAMRASERKAHRAIQVDLTRAISGHALRHELVRLVQLEALEIRVVPAGGRAGQFVLLLLLLMTVRNNAHSRIVGV